MSRTRHCGRRSSKRPTSRSSKRGDPRWGVTVIFRLRNGVTLSLIVDLRSMLSHRNIADTRQLAADPFACAVSGFRPIVEDDKTGVEYCRSRRFWEESMSKRLIAAVAALSISGSAALAQ